jgi:hypothetical protein
MKIKIKTRKVIDCPAGGRFLPVGVLLTGGVDLMVAKSHEADRLHPGVEP